MTKKSGQIYFLDCHTRYANARAGRTGTLWEGRCKSSAIDTDAYLLACCRYVELNPVRARMVEHPDAYPWSSYRAHVGMEPVPWLDMDPGYLGLGSTPAERQARYAQWVAEAIPVGEWETIRRAIHRGQLTGDAQFGQRNRDRFIFLFPQDRDCADYPPRGRVPDQGGRRMGVALLGESLGLPHGPCSGLQGAKASASMATSAEGPPLSVERVTEVSSFLALQPVWNKLCDVAGIDHPFLRYEWVHTWWECFGAGKELFVLLVKSGQEIIAIAPLMLSWGRMYGLKVRRLEFISNVHTPRFDFIIMRQPEEAYRAIWTYLVGCSALWDVLNLGQLPAGSRTLDELQRLAAKDGFLSGLWRSENSPYLPLRGTWDGYVKGLHQKHRSNLRNQLKRLSRRGEVAVETIASIEHVASALTDGLRLEAAAWKGDAGTAICCRPEVQLFYTKLAERAAERGWLRLYFLTLDHHRIAFQYSMRCRDNLYLLKPGYDPAYAPYSPSNLLCYLVLRDAFDHGLSEHDFLGTAEPWKLKWTLETRPHSWLFVFPRLLRPRLLHYFKFRLIPTLRQSRFYPRLRDTLLRLRIWGQALIS